MQVFWTDMKLYNSKIHRWFCLHQLATPLSFEHYKEQHIFREKILTCSFREISLDGILFHGSEKWLNYFLDIIRKTTNRLPRKITFNQSILLTSLYHMSSMTFFIIMHKISISSLLNDLKTMLYILIRNIDAYE